MRTPVTLPRPNGKQLTDVWHCGVLLSHKYVRQAKVKEREIRLKGKLQPHLVAELASRCSQVMGHVCAPPHLNLTAAVVGSVITEVRHKSEKVFFLSLSRKKGKRERKTRGRDWYCLGAGERLDALTDPS